MRKILEVMVSCLMVSFATLHTMVINTEAQPPARTETAIGESQGPILASPKKAKPLYGEVLKDIETSTSSFNPTRGDAVTISFSLTHPAKVTAAVYDPDRGLVRTLISGEDMNAGKQTLDWDGKDLDGRAVPDEAYFFTVTAESPSGGMEIYDPTLFSGGAEHDITSAEVSGENQTISYIMPEMGRVLIRIGIASGPLMDTLVDWEPRVKGNITEYWNGKDKDGLVDIYDHPKFKMIITYFTLPENSVICFGNRALSYRDYKIKYAVNRPVKPERESTVARQSHHYNLPRSIDYSPRITVEFQNIQGRNEEGVIALKDRTLVKVTLDEKDRAIFENQKFEIVFFLDYQFYSEDEAGYTPFNWVWDLSNVEAGEHLFTVNLSSFKDQIGILSRKIKVIK